MSQARSIVFVLPTEAARQIGPVAAWLNTAGWVSAAGSLGYETTVLSPAGALDAEALRRSTAPETTELGEGKRLKAFLPIVVKTAMKDVRELGRAIRFSRRIRSMHFESAGVEFVWQRHELFHSAGHRLAHRLGRPFVLYVAAPKVWEARQWGVNRPGWAALVERIGEKSILRSADLVACVSEEVAEVIRAMGVPDRRIVVTPSTVDTSLFEPDIRTSEAQESHELTGRFVIGWSGSFRRFHALDVLIEALPRIRAEIPEVLLMLVGSGPEKPHIQAKVAQRQLEEHVRFVDTVDQESLPGLLAACDVTVLLGQPSQSFHYSPLKLWEYLSMGRAVVAAADGSTARMLSAEETALLVPPGDADSLARAIIRLRSDPGLCQRLGSNARLLAERESWEKQLRRVIERLEARALP